MTEKKLRPLTRPPIILWAGPKHSGKTTSAARLVQAARAGGFAVAGCLAPSVYVDGSLVGFDVVNLCSGERASLAWRQTGLAQARRFRFSAEGLALGTAALSPAAIRDADLIVVDEYGPLELAFQGWRSAVDRLVNTTDAVLLLVVREELAGQVRRLYGSVTARTLLATRAGSIDEVLAVLGNNRP